MTFRTTLRLFMFDDEAYRSIVDDKSSFLRALSIVAIVSTIVGAFSYMIQLLLLNLGASVLSRHPEFADPELAVFIQPELTFSIQQLIQSAGGNLIVALIGLFIWTGIIVVFSRLVFSARQGTYKEIFSVFGHAYIVLLFSFIPLIGFLAWIYYVMVGIKGLSVLTGLSVGRAFGAYALAFVLVAIFSFVLALILFFLGPPGVLNFF